MYVKTLYNNWNVHNAQLNITAPLCKRVNMEHDVQTNKDKPVANHANHHNLNFIPDFLCTKTVKSLPKE